MQKAASMSKSLALAVVLSSLWALTASAQTYSGGTACTSTCVDIWEFRCNAPSKFFQVSVDGNDLTGTYNVVLLGRSTNVIGHGDVQFAGEIGQAIPFLAGDSQGLLRASLIISKASDGNTSSRGYKIHDVHCLASNGSSSGGHTATQRQNQ